MKIHLEFNDDEQQLAMRAIHGSKAFTGLWDINHTLRNLLKHGDPRFKTPQELAMYLHNEICELLENVTE